MTAIRSMHVMGMIVRVPNCTSNGTHFSLEFFTMFYHNSCYVFVFPSIVKSADEIILIKIKTKSPSGRKKKQQSYYSNNYNEFECRLFYGKSINFSHEIYRCGRK